jgi:hypothetical protein
VAVLVHTLVHAQACTLASDNDIVAKSIKKHAVAARAVDSLVMASFSRPMLAALMLAARFFYSSVEWCTAILEQYSHGLHEHHAYVLSVVLVPGCA